MSAHGEDAPASVEVELADLSAGGGPVAEPELGAAAARLVSGSAIYALANFGIKALNFFLLPLYTRFLTPADYGLISLAETVAAVVATLLGMGLEPGMRRLYFQYVDDAGKLARYLGSVMRFSLLVTGAVVVLALLAGPRILRLADPHLEVPFYPYIALAIGAAALSQLVQYRLGLFQVQAKPREYGWLALALFVATAACALLLVVVYRWGAYGMLLGKLIASAALALVALWMLRHWLGAKTEWAFVLETLPLSLPLVPHSLMALGLVVADRFILERYRSLDEVGLYSLAYTLGMVMYLVSLSIAQAWQPIYFDTARAGDATGRRMLGTLSSGLATFLSAVAFIGVLIAPEVARVLDPRYRAVGRLIPWIIGGYLLHAMFGLFHLSVLQGKRTQFILFASAMAFVANIGLNLWWVPAYGMYGAAYATLVAYGLEALVMYAYAQRLFPLPYQWSRIVLAMVVVAAGLWLTQMGWMARTGFGLRLSVTLGTMVAGTVALWMLGARTVGEPLLALIVRRVVREPS
jgi:O-antigen/teichoic acid export membrane protein